MDTRGLCVLGCSIIPSVKEPSVLLRSDGKQSVELTLIPCQAGKYFASNTTVVEMFAASYIAACSAAEERKEVDNSAIPQSHILRCSYWSGGHSSEGQLEN